MAGRQDPGEGVQAEVPPGPLSRVSSTSCRSSKAGVAGKLGDRERPGRCTRQQVRSPRVLEAMEDLGIVFSLECGVPGGI